MFGYGYSRPTQELYEPPRLDCGLKDFDKAVKEYDFLDNLDDKTSQSILQYYTTELNRTIKLNLYCIVSIDLRAGVVNTNLKIEWPKTIGNGGKGSGPKKTE